MIKLKWARMSASQHCARRWYYGWIDKIKQPTSPAMQRGTDIHKEAEHYLRSDYLDKASVDGNRSLVLEDKTSLPKGQK